MRHNLPFERHATQKQSRAVPAKFRDVVTQEWQRVIYLTNKRYTGSATAGAFNMEEAHTN